MTLEEYYLDKEKYDSHLSSLDERQFITILDFLVAYRLHFLLHDHHILTIFHVSRPYQKQDHFDVHLIQELLRIFLLETSTNSYSNIFYLIDTFLKEYPMIEYVDTPNYYIQSLEVGHQ